MRKMMYIYKSQSREGSTVYLYEKTVKTILPVTFYESTYDPRGVFLKSVLHALEGFPYTVEIYLFQSSRYYSYLHLKNHHNGRFRVNCEIGDALYLAKNFNLPIYAHDRVLKKCGIKITKELLYDSLRYDVN